MTPQQIELIDKFKKIYKVETDLALLNRLIEELSGNSVEWEIQLGKKSPPTDEIEGDKNINFF